MTYPLLQAKLANHFRLLDIDGDGAIEREDYLAAATRICTAFGVDVSAPAAIELHGLYGALFDRTPGAADGRITFEEFLDRFEDPVAMAPVAELVPRLAQAMVAVCDVNGDGELSGQEFRRLLGALGVAAEHADDAFHYLDIDLSGFLSAAELSEALEECYCSDDPDAPGNWLLGPVAPCGPTARLPYPDLDALPPATRAILDQLPQLNIFRMVAHAESAFPAAMGLTKALLGDLRLAGDLRELAVLQVAHELDATYVWTQHVGAARAETTSRRKIVAVRAGRLDAPCFSEVEQASLQFTAEVLHRNRATDATFARLAACLSPREIVELLLVVGVYTLVSRITTALDLDADRDQGAGVVAFARG